MYIKKLEINSFGLFSDKIFELKDGFNVLYGSNESGKSTLFAFIVFMFYGTKIKKTQGELTFKEKYMPWNGSPMHGRITFVHQGSEYVLERMCLSSRNTVKLHCLTTGEEIKERTILNAVGEYFLGIGSQSLYNSCYISGAADAFMSVDELISKLTSTAENTSVEVSYNEIMDIINEEILNLSSPKRKNALIPNLRNQIYEKNQKLIAIERSFDDAKSIKAENSAHLTAIRDIEEQIDDLNQENEAISESKTKNTEAKSYGLVAGIITVILLVFSIIFSNTFTTLIFVISLIITVLLALKQVQAKKKLSHEISTKLFTMKQNNVKIVSLAEQITLIKTQIATNEEKCRNLAAHTDDSAILASEVDALMNELEKANVRLEALQISKLALSNAYKQIRAVFSPRLSALSGEILSKITKGKYGDALVDDTFRVTVESVYGYKDASSLSQGANYQAYLAMRLALSKIVLSEASVPLFLDDALAYYDKERLSATLDYLTELSSDTQIIFSTCRESELNLLINKHANILYI